MMKKAIATMFTISLVFVVVIAMAIIPAVGKLAGGNSAISNSSTNSPMKELGTMAKQNKEMTAKMEQQVDEEAGALVKTCLDAEERGEQCDQIQVLAQLCESNGFFTVESCNDPRVREMLAS